MRHSHVRRIEAIEAKMDGGKRWDYMVPQFLPQTQEEALADRNAELRRAGMEPLSADGRIAYIVFRPATDTIPSPA